MEHFVPSVETNLGTTRALQHLANVSLCVIGCRCVRPDVYRDKNKKCEFYIVGTDAIYDKRKMDKMLRYYGSEGSKIVSLNNLLCQWK